MGCERDGSRWIDSGILEELVIRFMPPSPDPKLRPPTLTLHTGFSWEFPIAPTPVVGPEIELAAWPRVRGGVTRIEYCEEAEVFIRSDSQ